MRNDKYFMHRHIYNVMRRITVETSEAICVVMIELVNSDLSVLVDF